MCGRKKQLCAYFSRFFAFFEKKILGKSLENLKRNLKKTFNRNLKPKNSYYLKWDFGGKKFCSQNEMEKNVVHKMNGGRRGIILLQLAGCSRPIFECNPGREAFAGRAGVKLRRKNRIWGQLDPRN